MVFSPDTLVYLLLEDTGKRANEQEAIPEQPAQAVIG